MKVRGVVYSSVDLCYQLERLSYSDGPAWI